MSALDQVAKFRIVNGVCESCLMGIFGTIGHAKDCVSVQAQIELDLLRAQIAEQQARIQELEEDNQRELEVRRMIMDERCPSDEHHCSCVPSVRVYANELEDRIKNLTDANKYLQEERDMLRSELGKYETAFNAACDLIVHSPVDWDITPAQNIKYKIFKDIWGELLKGNEG